MKTSRLPNEGAKSVGIWIRVSTEDQANGESPKNHELRARHYTEAKGWIVAEVYDLAGVSGKSVLEHPEAQRMMKDVESGHITALVFSKLARLGRNVRDLIYLSDFFQKHQADLVSLHENVDTGTPAGRLFYNVIASMAQWEREEIVDRVNASILTRAKRGLPLNGKAPFGYEWKEKKLRPHPEEAPVRKLIYELFAEYQRKKAVARLLNERGLRTRDGSKFSDTTVGRLIEDPTAKGIHRANYTRRVADNQPWALKPEHEWVLTQVDPIVPVELWEKCNDLLEARKTRLQRPAKRVVHVFSGLVRCECGTKMYVPTNSPKYVCTACRNKIPIVDLDAVFREELQAYCISPEQTGDYLDRTRCEVDAKKRLLATMQAELQKIQTEGKKVYQLYLDGAASSQKYKELSEPLDTRKAQIETEIPRIQAEVDVAQVDGLSVEQIAAKGRDWHASWPNMNPQEQRTLAESLVKGVVIAKDEILWDLCPLPSFKDMTNRQRTV